jgi:hypothetical protein
MRSWRPSVSAPVVGSRSSGGRQPPVCGVAAWAAPANHGLVPAAMPADIRRRRDELVLQVQRVDDAAEVFAAASPRLRRLVPFDAAVAINLFRGRGRPPFSRREPQLVASLSAPLGEALRVRARPAESLGELVRRDRPGLRLFARDGTLVSANDPARAWLAELPDKVGVSSRGELVARLFADHYEPVHTRDVTRTAG